MANEPRPPQGQPEVRWDETNAATHACDVANSSSGPDDVVVNFGRRRPVAEAPDELAVEVVRRLSMRPMTARALRDMLRDLVAAIDAEPRSG